ncbi:MAG: hypothetical protein HYW48_05250 [Deltaproteobacteria bacterium]|nr:hypothetical protein [Deltaproteobacteria bacterium]
MATVSYGKVWESTENWGQKWEVAYSNWIASDAVSKDMFISRASPYFGIATDCADAAYAMRVIFSFERKLPFATLVKMNGRDVLLGNETDRFDAVHPPHKRLVAFVNYLSTVKDSSQLGYYDTYPVAVSALMPGDLYTFELKTRDGPIRHVLTIKRINDNGTFDFLYSTQNVRRNNLYFFRNPNNNIKVRSLLFKQNQEAQFRQKEESKGFRRFLWPNYLGQSPKTFPESFSYSIDQFEWARTLDRRQYANKLREELQKTVELPQVVLFRYLEQVCQLVLERVAIVKEAVDFLKPKGKKFCMDKEELFLYSTPMRDAILEESFEQLKIEWQKFTGKNELESTEQDLSLVRVLFDSRMEKSRLHNFCPVKVSPGLILDLRTIYSRLKSGKLSSNPNDSVFARWGEEKASNECQME